MKSIFKLCVVAFLLTVALQGRLCAELWSFKDPTKSDWVESSGTKDGDTLIITGKGYLYGIWVGTDGTNSVTMDVYDNNVGSGSKLIPQWVVSTSSTNRAGVVGFTEGLVFENGLYVDITTSGTTSYIVYYRSKN